MASAKGVVLGLVSDSTTRAWPVWPFRIPWEQSSLSVKRTNPSLRRTKMNPPTRGYGALVVVGCCLAAVAFAVGQHPQTLSRSERAAARVRYLHQIASIHMLPGMTSTEVADCLALHGLRQLSIVHLGSTTVYFGRDGLFDPVIAVDFNRKRRVTEWRVEE